MVMPRLCGAARPLHSSLCGAARPLRSSLRPALPCTSLLPSRLSTTDSAPPPSGLLDRLLGLASNTAAPSTNRWAMFIPAFCTHVCLGAPYGWSAISGQLTREHGLVTSAATDWALDLATYPMSVILACGGLSAAIFGGVAGKIGVRKSLALGGVVYGSGFGVAAAGVAWHSLPLLYAGNFLCGLGYGGRGTLYKGGMLDWILPPLLLHFDFMSSFC